MAKYTVENNQLVRNYLSAIRLDLLDDYDSVGRKRPASEGGAIELEVIKSIDDVLEELERNLQQIEDGIAVQWMFEREV
jgi:hypothetical protein